MPEGFRRRATSSNSRRGRNALAAVLATLVAATSALAQDVRTTGSVTRLPIPRFVSLKPSDTPMREGPSKEHRIKWVFKREGLPVEVIGEHEQWRRVRDSEATEGWVYHGRLSNRRTAIVLAGKDAAMRAMHQREGETSPLVARLEPGVIANLESCSAEWCKVWVEGYEGFIRKSVLWGVYQDEKLK